MYFREAYEWLPAEKAKTNYLHTIQHLTRLIASLALCIPFAACHESANHTPLYLQLNGQLEQATEWIQQGTEVYYRSLDEKTYDPHTAEKAGIWLAKAKQIRQLRAGLFDYLIDCKWTIQLKKVVKEPDSLAQKIEAFTDAVSLIDSGMTGQFAKHIRELPKLRDSMQAIAYRLGEAPALCLLSQLQNKVAVLENMLIAYCNANVGSNYDGFAIVEPLINQNLTQLNRNEELRVQVGLGYLNYPDNPKVYVNGDSLRTNDAGYFEYNMKIAGNPGKYKLPVTIEYYRDHEKVTVHKMVEYLVY